MSGRRGPSPLMFGGCLLYAAAGTVPQYLLLRWAAGPAVTPGRYAAGLAAALAAFAALAAIRERAGRCRRAVPGGEEV